MNYYDILLNIAIFMMFVMAIYFFIILCFGTGYRIHSFIILAACIIGLAIPEVKNDSVSEFIRGANTSMLLDGVTAFTLTMFLLFDRLAKYQAGLLVFATTVHFMLIWDVTISSSWFTLFFYTYYDELLITVGVLQIMVSHNGFIAALRNIREIVRSVGINNWSHSKAIHQPQDKGSRA